MEPQIVNEITITEELFRESFPLVFSVRKQKTLFLCGLVTALAGAAFLALQILFRKVILMGLPLVLMRGAVMVWSLVLPGREEKRKYKALCARSGGKKLYRRIEFYEESLSVFSEHSKPVNIAYADVEQMKETERMIVLICVGHLGVMLAKDGFVRGTGEMLHELLVNTQKETG